MKFAVKRIWPKMPAQWEDRGEADSAKAFALGFAESRTLAEAVELVVIEDEGDEDDRATRFYRVVGTNPYSVKPADPRPITAGGTAPAQKAAAADGAESGVGLEGPPGERDERPVEMADLRPFGSFLFFSMKIMVVFVAVLFIVRGIRWYFIG